MVARAYVADPETRGLRELLRYRAFLVGLQGAVKNRIHALLDRLGVRPPMPTLFSRKGLKLRGLLRELREGLLCRALAGGDAGVIPFLLVAVLATLLTRVQSWVDGP